MKIIKFRAWDKENKRWMTPEIEDSEESELRLDIWGNLHFKSPWFEQESGTVTIVAGESMFDLSQYTGLKDKNGVEIYEGDIIKLIGTYKDIKGKELGRYMVEWNNYYTGFYPLIDDPLEGGGTEYEVIGNIYENPEL